MHLHKVTLGLLISALAALPAAAATKEENRVIDATAVMDQLMRIPEQSIPPALLSRAHAIAVVPNVVKVGFGLGARRGKGVLVVRQEDGTWSNPAFITVTGGSIGFQVGAQSTDIILVFKTRQGVDGITRGKLTLGADASIAAGPVGRQAAVATDATFRSEVYSYSRSRGLFAGVALEGAGVTMDRKANAAYYGSARITPEQIFSSSGNAAPESANVFVQTLAAQTSRLPVGPAIDASEQIPQRRDPALQETQRSDVRTYGMNDEDEDVPD